MRTTTLCSLLAASMAIALPIAPTARPRMPSAKERRQIGVSIIGSTTISGKAVEEFASAAEVAAAAVTGGGEAGGDASATESAAGATETGSSGGEGGNAGGEGEAPPAEGEGDAPAEGDAPPEEAPPEEAPPAEGDDQAAADQKAVDLVVMNFALTLERLETEFYKKGIESFDKATMIESGLSATQADIVLQTITQLSIDEQTHTDFLKAGIQALGGTPAESCNFDFSAVLANPATFISAARTLELVGVSAYAGGSALISDPTLLTDAASILSIEARHQSALNVFSGGTFAAQAFDIPLAPEQVLALAGGFLKDCKPEDLGLTSNMPLSAINSNTGNTLISANSLLAFESPVLTADTDASTLTCQMIVGGQQTAIVQPLSKCQVPSNVNGAVMVFVSNDTQPLQTNVNQQNKKQIIAGPAAVFIDAGQETFQQLFSIQGFGIQQLASLDMGSIAIRQLAAQGLEPIDIIAQSNPEAKNTNPIRDGMIYGNQKRGYVSPGGGKVLGWRV